MADIKKPTQQNDANGRPIEVLMPIPDESISVDGTSVSTPSAAIEAWVVRCLTLADTCRIAFGSTPVATSADMLLAANAPEYFRIVPGEKIAVLGGVVEITPMT